MLQIRLLGQFDIRLDRKRITIPSRVGQSLFAYLVLTAGTPHRREKLAGLFWPDTTDDVARKYLRQELWRIRKALSARQNEAEEYLLADEFTIAFNRNASYWLDVAQLERPDLDLESLTSNLSLYQGELLPGFYEDWIVLERERILSIFDSKMGQLLDLLVAANRWTAVQEQAERWLAVGNATEPAFRALMLAYGTRGDMAKVSSVYQRCISELQEQYGLEPSAETRALYDGLLKGANVPGRPALHPSGTVTFLFTDIEGSTNLLDKLGDQYAEVLATHHTIMRNAIQKWNGREVDTQGDAFFVTFARAIDAVQCAAEMQRNLQTHPWEENKSVRVRMGLHTGEPLIASTGYVGMDVHRAARIGDAAHGGQVVLSQTTRELVRNELPKAITIRDLGEHRLKDLKFPTPIYQLVIEGLASNFPPVRTKFSGTEAPTPGEPPFKGLQYFDEADYDLFFGREVLTAKLIDHLRRSNFLSVIIGASGSGKSSLVRAGLIPALKNGQTLIDGLMPPEGSNAWQIHIITPTEHPLEALATEMTRDSDSVMTAAAWVVELTQDPCSLAHLLEKQAHRHTLLCIDQFEELFTLCRDEFEREAFIDNLLTAINQESNRFTLVLTLRADFYAHLAQYPELRDAVAKQQEYIGPMSMEELRRAIEEPAKRGHWAFEPGLVDLILRDIGDEPGALPLLSHALLETWKRRAGHVLTLKGYAEAGGVHGAIAHTAESVYQNLSPEEQRIARDIFLRLTELGEGTEDTRRRASFDELMSDAETAGEVRQVLNMLADARLLTLNEDTAEVAHEALIREWPTLREWLNQDREGLQLHRRLTEAAHEWELLERDPGVLFRGIQLAQAREWAVSHSSALNTGERAFLNASIEQEKHEEQEREEQRQRELAAAKEIAETQRNAASRLRTRNRVITTVLSIAVILALLAGLFGVQSNRNAVQAETNFNRAEAQRLATEVKGLLLENGNAEAIALLALRSLNTQYTPQGDEALVAASLLDYPIREFLGHTNRVKAVDFSHDGRYILTGSADSTVRLWDRQNGQQIRQFSGDMQDVNTAVFSPDSRFILTGSRFDHTVRLWNVETGEELRRFSEGNAAAFSLDGQRIFVHSEEGYGSMMIDLKSGEILHTISAPQMYRRVESTGYSPDGTLYVDAPSDEEIVYIREVLSDREILRVPPFTENFAFSSDNHYIALPDNFGNIFLWDLRTGELFQTLSNDSRDISIMFSPDNRLLATGSDDGVIRIWDVQTGEQIRHLRGHNLTARIIRFSPDGSFIMSGGFDQRALLWELISSPALLHLKKENHDLYTSSFSRDGAYIAGGREDGSVLVWNANTGELIWEFQAGNETVLFADFVPDNSLLVTSSDLIRIWDLKDGTMLREFSLNLSPNHPVNSIDVSSEYVLAAYDGADNWTGGVIAWDIQTGAEVQRLTSPMGAQSVLISPDEKRVATYTIADYQARLFDMATGEEMYIFPVENNTAFPLGFSQDSQFLFTGGNVTSALWDLSSGKQSYEIVGPKDVIGSSAFSHDGRYFVTSSFDSIRIWDHRTGQEVRRITPPFDPGSVGISENDDSLFVHGFDAKIYILHTHVQDMMNDLCSRLIRDFTTEEREQYEIRDNVPTCP